jgi:hypothetical protein
MNYIEKKGMLHTNKGEKEDNSYSYGVSVTKARLLNNLVVTVTSGKIFYCDPTSRADISDAILEAQDMGALDTFVTQWKTVDGILDVTVAELKEARRLGLQAKATLVGVVNV